MNVIVRNVNDAIWKKARIKAINANVSMTQVIAKLIEMWVKDEIELDTKKLTKKRGA